MLSIISVEFVIGALALLFAYLISVTCVGVAHLSVAQWAGDTVSIDEEQSYNPLNFTDMLGLMCTITFGFGWGRMLPFQPLSARQPFKSLRVLLVYLTQPFVSLLLAAIALVANIMLIGPKSLCFAMRYALLDSLLRVISVQQLATVASNKSTAVLVIAIILITIVSLNIFMAVWSLIHNACYHILYLGAEHGYNYMRHAELLLILVPLGLFILFFSSLRILFLQLTATAAYTVAAYLGVS